jgi:phi13 family phage major tail protein
MAKIGLSNFYYALNIKDDSTGATYSAPEKVAGIISADIKTGSDTATLFADNGPAETASSLGEITVDIELKDIPLETQAILLGHKITAGVMESNADDVAPDVAIMFESLKSNGKRRFVKLLKGKFQEPDDTNKTKEDKISFQTQKISGKFVIREFDGAWKRTTDEDATGYLPATGVAWYTSVDPT